MLKVVQGDMGTLESRMGQAQSEQNHALLAQRLCHCREENAQLIAHTQHDAEDLAVLRKAGPGQEAALKLAADRDKEKLAALMRAEKAEANAVAAHNELLDVTKRYLTIWGV